MNIKFKKNILIFSVIFLYTTQEKASDIPTPPTSMPELSPDNKTLGFYTGSNKTGNFIPIGAKIATNTSNQTTPTNTQKKSISTNHRIVNLSEAKPLRKTGINLDGDTFSSSPTTSNFLQNSITTKKKPEPSQPTKPTLISNSNLQQAATAPRPIVAKKSPYLNQMVEFIDLLKSENMLFYNVEEIQQILFDLQNDEKRFLTINLTDTNQLTKLKEFLEKEKVKINNYIPSSRKTSTASDQTSIPTALLQTQIDTEINTFIDLLIDNGMLNNFSAGTTTIFDIEAYLKSLLASDIISVLNPPDLLDQNSDLRQTLDTLVISLQPEQSISVPVAPPLPQPGTLLFEQQQQQPQTAIPAAPPALPTFPAVTSTTATPQTHDLLAEIRQNSSNRKSSKAIDQTIEQRAKAKEKAFQESDRSNLLAIIGQQAAKKTNQNQISSTNTSDDDDDEWNDGNNDQDDNTTRAKIDYKQDLENALKRNHTIDVENHPNYSQLTQEQRDNLKKMKSNFILKDKIENDLKKDNTLNLITTYSTFETLPLEDQLDILSQQIRGFLADDSSYKLIFYPLWNKLTPLIRLSFLVRQNKKYDYQNDPDWDKLTNQNKRQIRNLVNPQDLLARRAAVNGDD